MRKGDVKIIGNIRVGRADAKPTTPTHVTGVFEGNHPYATQRHKGIEDTGKGYAWAGARRSTGIRAKQHDAIDPRMPKLSPS